MKIVSLILLILGFVICGVCGLVIFYATYTGISGFQNESGSAGIADVTWGLSTAYLASFGNLLGFGILGLGILLAAVGMFTGRKQQQN